MWTSGAQYSDIGEIITRTNPDKPKHKGLTMFLVDMHAPGVEVRPLRQMTGGASFNEVFFNEVRVPDSHRLGDVDEGWTGRAHDADERAGRRSAAAVPASARERFSRLIETGPALRRGRRPDRAPELCRRLRRAERRRGTRTCGRWRRSAPASCRARRCRSASCRSRTNMTRIGELLASRCSGPRLVADTGEWGTYAWAEFVLGVPGMRVAGGTDEIMRNIIGERVLGLPKDPPPKEPALKAAE